jgi:RimJ/RimL family protein N-acetyltransferase
MPTETISRARICPFVDDPAVEDMQPAILADLYLRTKRDGLLDIVFPGEGKTNFAKFIRHVQGPDSLFVLGMIEGEDPPVAGYGWLFQQHGVKPEASATLGFCFMRKYWGRPEILEIAKQTGVYWLNQGYRVLYGISLERNAVARGFARRLGCQELNILPHYFYENGVLVPAMQWCIERDEFLEAVRTEGE